MAKTGQLLPTAIGTASPNIVKYPEQGGWFPYSTNIINSLGAGKVKRGNNQPAGRAIKGQLLPCYFNDFYFRVHIVPTSLDLGNIVSSQEHDIYLWNAYFTSKRLTAISGLTEGMVLDGQTAPYTFTPLQEKYYKLTITPDGAPNIDNNISWVFDSESPSIHITGNRVTAFTFRADWSDGVTERLEWSTDILTSESGVEQRSALYLTPRRYFKTDFILHQKERQLFNNMMSWSAKNWAIPLWPYIQISKQPLTTGDSFISCTTEHMDFLENGLAILWRDPFTYEIVEITTITNDGLNLRRPLLNDWARGTRIYPLRVARFNSTPQLVRKTDNLQTVNIEFQLAETSPYTAIAPTASYLNYPVFELRPEESEDLTNEYQRLLITLDNKMALPLVTDTSGFSFLIQSYKWQALGREDRASYKSLLYYLKGRQKAIWIPSHADDLTVVARIAATEPLITITECGYSRYAVNDTDKQHIAIYLCSGEVFYRQITNAAVLNDGTEQLTLDSSLGQIIEPKQIMRVCFMRLCRLNSDRVEIDHMTDSEGVAASKITFKRVRDNEL
ncbi:hypothetical protein MTZ49_01480 [Entomomonas sp. E2T0]|uniref:hypothetical protein n=1 Tax=Entomomonas sp. E2T0 TaxID=2930213 RepID=UPI00222829CC|nr:hypothetical protein [Entomomonas sp. E2T0]UYZ84279.1 hypothetical protein MTZ49_01480 [Entomomonas sp. E2T0]